MTKRAFLLAAPAALLAAPAAAQLSDYRLPPAPTPTPRVIGPLPDTPTPRQTPTPTPTPAPAPSTPAPAPAPTTAPPRINIPSAATPAPSARPLPRPSPLATAAAARPNAAAPVAAAPSPSAAPSSSAAPLATSSPALPAPLPNLAGPAAIAPPTPARTWWPWIVALFLASGAAFGALLWLRRRIGPLGPLVVPEIERPRVPPPSPGAEPLAPSPAPAPAPLPAEPHPLHIEIELRKLSLTMMNATLGYRLKLTNGGAEPLEDIAVAADLIAAHGSLSREMLLAGPATELPVHHRLPRLAPGESGDVAGELRLPLNQVRAISRGSAKLFVPLARFRVGAAGQEARCFTLVAGQPSPSGNGAIQPVRLDHGPRIYDGLAGRAF